MGKLQIWIFCVSVILWRRVAKKANFIVEFVETFIIIVLIIIGFSVRVTCILCINNSEARDC